MGDADLHDRDFALWSEQQADALRRHAADEIDWENVAEEIEGLSRNDKRVIYLRLAIICAHLLKWRYQSTVRSNSGRGSAVEARNRIDLIIDDSPSLRSYPERALMKAYAAGRRVVEAETGLTDLPTDCPWTIEQVLDRNWPEHTA